MCNLNYASFIDIFKDGVFDRYNDLYLANVLLGSIYETVTVRRRRINKTEEPDIYGAEAITSTEASNFKKRKANIPRALVVAAASKKVIINAPAYFAENIVPLLNPDKRSKMFTALRNFIKNDDEISAEKKKELLHLGESLTTSEQQAAFLAAVFLYAVKQENKRSSKNEGKIKQIEESKDTSLNLKQYAVDVPPSLTTIPAAVELIGREKSVLDIQDLLGQQKIVYIHADGGVGKTALAAQIANAVKDDVMTGRGQFRHVAWITSTGNLKNDLITLWIPAVINAQSLEDKYAAARSFMQITPTFLVIDNMDKLPSRDEVNELNTFAGRTKILITSRADIPIGKRYILNDLDSNSALLLFYQHYWKGKDLTINQITEQDDKSYAQNIVEAAAYNTLFIELIAKMAYEDHWKLDALWKELEKDVFCKESKHSISTNHGEGRLLAQIENLYEMSSLSDKQKEIMSFIALFPPEQSLFFDVFEWAGFEDDEVDNLGELERRGWIERGDEGYLIHTMVRASIEQQQGRATFDEDKYEKLINELADTDQYMLEDMVYTKIQERIVVPETICRIFTEKECKKEIVGSLFNNVGMVHLKQSGYEKALRYFEKAMSIREETLGKNHPDTATTYNALACWHHGQGNYKEAFIFFQKALAIDENVLGKEHLSTAEVYNNIARLYFSQGKYKIALRYYEKALLIREKKLGKDHPSTAQIYCNIACVYDVIGEYEKALEYHEKDRVIVEKKYGMNHPETASTYNNIGMCYCFQKNYKEALKYFQKAQAICEEKLGKEHSATEETYSNIAIVACEMGDYKEAMVYYQKALEINERIFGEDHPNTAANYANMATLYHKQGDDKEALEYYRKALVIFEKVQGDHRNTANIYNAIGSIYEARDNYDDATEYRMKAFDIYQKALKKEQSGDELSDINALSGLRNLTYLDLAGNELSDINALSSLTNLTDLDLRDNNLSDISALAGLKNLTILNLADNQVRDISALAGLTNLMKLNLSFNQLSDISALAGLTNLTVLDLGVNKLTDISVLAGLTNLTQLALSMNRLRDVGVLSELTKLDSLYLNNNQLSSISALSGLMNLTCLNLDNNQLSDINALSSLKNLTELSLHGNEPRSIRVLSGLTNLTELNLGYDQLSDINALSGLTNLTKLILHTNHLNDISELSGLTNLTWLGLSSNEVSDISALSNLKNLKYLNLRFNQLNDISALSELTKLEQLGLFGNPVLEKMSREEILEILSGAEHLTYIDF